MKKTLTLLIAGIVFFTATTVAYARMMTMNEIADDFNENFIEPLRKDGSSLNATLNETDKTFTVNYGTEELMKFNYTDEYMEYDVRGIEITEEVADNGFVQFFIINYLLDSVFRVSGHDGYTLSDEEADYGNMYDTYGIQIESEEYYFEGDGTNGNTSWAKKGDYITYLKISFDTDKIDALVSRYGKKIDSGINLSLEVANVTQTSIKLIPHFTKEGDDDLGTEYYCDIYRSSEKDGVYTSITDKPIYCFDINGYEDKELESGKTYYYKLKLVETNIISEPVEATTLSSSVLGNAGAGQKEKPEENPPTGVGFYTITTLLLIIGSILLSRVVKRKSVFQKL